MQGNLIRTYFRTTMGSRTFLLAAFMTKKTLGTRLETKMSELLSRQFSYARKLN